MVAYGPIVSIYIERRILSLAFQLGMSLRTELFSSKRKEKKIESRKIFYCGGGCGGGEVVIMKLSFAYISAFLVFILVNAANAVPTAGPVVASLAARVATKAAARLFGAQRELRGDCENSDSFQFDGDATKTCDLFVAKKPNKRCKKKQLGTGIKLKFFCPATCKSQCKKTDSPTSSPTVKRKACENSDSFQFKDNPELTCDSYVAKQPRKRCRKEQPGNATQTCDSYVAEKPNKRCKKVQPGTNEKKLKFFCPATCRNRCKQTDSPTATPTSSPTLSPTSTDGTVTLAEIVEAAVKALQVIADLPANADRRQRFLSTCPEPVVECTATGITCDFDDVDTTGFTCYAVTCTITASACSNIDTAEKVVQIEIAVEDGDLEKALLDEGIIANTASPTESSYPSINPTSD
ncbi:hypothetical protein FRACYDRAFT_250726 [Fragilariopsis cylindrus CCMP1102]|uniref:Uncharacterized protein n=1 Tax=Fragilariopsis cylindrus CCMP1102 TaxID=635003 RepID=A0A1E7EQ85_9STRA|nr:hypothetical protein FRACYDRAFT_250726 [Fragilariopsis cylindrus CCMP1102]|eukprot:OEU07703.1 hypothetical protein FRACYDRAFT_250726 [Fragilariopsis cylindrus CCMP1102]